MIRHYDQCLTLKTVPNIISPKEGDTYKFVALQALENALFICYFDTETKLDKCDDKKSILNRHEMIAYSYVILNKNKETYITLKKRNELFKTPK